MALICMFPVKTSSLLGVCARNKTTLSFCVEHPICSTYLYDIQKHEPAFPHRNGGHPDACLLSLCGVTAVIRAL